MFCCRLKHSFDLYVVVPPFTVVWLLLIGISAVSHHRYARLYTVVYLVFYVRQLC